MFKKTVLEPVRQRYQNLLNELFETQTTKGRRKSLGE